MLKARYNYCLTSAWISVVLFCLFVSPVLAKNRPQVPKDFQKFFVHYVDKRSIWDKALNAIDVELKDIGRSFALIAGVSQYPNMSLTARELKAAAQDLEKLQQYLKTYEFFDEIVVLKEGDVTYENLQFFLQTYFPERLKEFPKSRFLFAYSGHGMNEGPSGYLLKNTARSLTDKADSINLSVIKVLVDEVVSSGHHVLVLLNACYSGAFLKRPFGGPTKLIPKHRGAHAITAGGTDELAWHDPKIGPGSVFFEKFFAGLDGRADSSGDGLVGVYELFTYLQNEIQIFTDQNQNPWVGDLSLHGSKGQFFFLNRDRQVAKGVVPEWKPERATPFGRRGWLGIGIQDLTQEVRKQLGVSDREGAVIVKIPPGSPAERADLKIGDIVKEIDGQKVRNVRELIGQVLMKEVGEEAALKISRSGREMTVPVRVGELPRNMKPESDLTSKGISPPQVTQHTPPKAPTDLRAAVAGQKEVRLEWADNADNETGFKVMRRVGGESQFREYATVGENQNLYLDQHADKPGTDYQYMIQAFNDVGKSVPSNMASVKIPLARPEAPADLGAQAVGPTQVKLEWKDRADNERGFKIERRAGTEGGFRVIDTLGPNQESFYDKRLRPGAKYEYRVRAFNDGGESGYSNPVSIRMANPSWATASGFLAMVEPGRQFVDDISGLKICGSQRSLNYLRESTGVKDFVPVTLHAPESYTALKTGVCKALVVYMDDPKKLREYYFGMRYNEVAPYVILLP